MISEKIRLLYVEDNPGDFRLIQIMLRSEGAGLITMEHADRLTTGLDRLGGGNFDLILLDLGLPEIQGLETLRQFMTQVADIPILVLTGLDDETVGLQAVQEGAQDYLIKGKITAALLVRAIRYAIERGRAEKVLRDREARYRRIVETANEGIWEIDNQFRIAFLNQKMADMLGYQPEEMLGRLLTDFMFEEELTDPQARIKERICGVEGQYEQRFLRRNGSTCWTIVSATVLKNGAGQFAGSFGMFTDITTRRKAEELIKESLAEKEVLLREIHHRVKNNLQIISTLLYLQSLGTDEKDVQEILRNSQDRVKSIALIHETLYMSENIGKIDFDDYIRKLVTYLSQSYEGAAGRIAFNIDSDKTTLDIDTAIPCGMIMSEMISNSLKHAFPGDRRGEIYVGFHSKGEGQYELVVNDDGIGMNEADAKRGKTLGVQLIDIFAKQLKATLRLDTSQGTKYEMHFEGKEK